MQQYGWLDISHTITATMPGGTEPYVPDTSDYTIPYKDQITIEQLLQHTAGVYDVDNDPVPGCEGNNYVEWMLEQNPDYQFTNAEQVRQDAIHQLSYFAPGTDYHYSDTGYTLLAEIIGRVLLLPFGDRKELLGFHYGTLGWCGNAVPSGHGLPVLGHGPDYAHSLCLRHGFYTRGR